MRSCASPFVSFSGTSASPTSDFKYVICAGDAGWFRHGASRWIRATDKGDLNLIFESAFWTQFSRVLSLAIILLARDHNNKDLVGKEI